MNITELKAKYEINGNIEKQLDNIYPMKTIIDIPIEYEFKEYIKEYNETRIHDLTSIKAVRLTMEVLYPNYPKEEVKNAMKIACLKFLEEFC